MVGLFFKKSHISKGGSSGKPNNNNGGDSEEFKTKWFSTALAQKYDPFCTVQFVAVLDEVLKLQCITHRNV